MLGETERGQLRMDNPETQSKDKLNKNTASLHLPLYCFTRSVSQMTKDMFHLS